MEDAPVISLVAIKLNDRQDYERYSKWTEGAFLPLFSKTSSFAKNRYKVTEEKPEYSSNITVFRFKSVKDYLNYWKLPDNVNVLNDIQSTWGNKGHYAWNYLYQIERASYNPTLWEGKKENINDTTIHIEAFDISTEKGGTYYMWFSDLGYEVYISRILKRSGIIGYEHLRYAGKHNEYGEIPPIFDTGDLAPFYFSIFYFDNVQHCKDFVNSRELAAYRAALSPYFPEGLKLKWNVDYQLIGSWKNDYK